MTMQQPGPLSANKVCEYRIYLVRNRFISDRLGLSEKHKKMMRSQNSRFGPHDLFYLGFLNPTVSMYPKGIQHILRWVLKTRYLYRCGHVHGPGRTDETT